MVIRMKRQHPRYHLKEIRRLTEREILMARAARSIGRGQDVIYHGTRHPEAVFRSGKLISRAKDDTIYFTRSPEVAAHFACLSGDWTERWSPAILVLNRRTIKQQYRLEPSRCWNEKDEREECIFGRNINFRRHLIGAVREADIASQIKGPTHHDSTLPSSLDQDQVTFDQELKFGRTLVKAGRARVRAKIARDRRASPWFGNQDRNHTEICASPSRRQLDRAG